MGVIEEEEAFYDAPSLPTAAGDETAWEQPLVTRIDTRSETLPSPTTNTTTSNTSRTLGLDSPWQRPSRQRQSHSPAAAPALSTSYAFAQRLAQPHDAPDYAHVRRTHTSPSQASTSTDGARRLRPRRSATFRASLQEAPAIPPIPSRFLVDARHVPLSLQASRPSNDDPNITDSSASNTSSRRSPITGTRLSQNRSRAVPRAPVNGANLRRTPVTDPSSSQSRRKSLSLSQEVPLHHSTSSPRLDMARRRAEGGEDLFLELAQDNTASPRDYAPPSRALSRLSQVAKRRSLPPAEPAQVSTDYRPRSSGSILTSRPQSRLGALQSDLHRHVDRYRSPHGRTADDAVSVSGRSLTSHGHRFSNMADRASASPSSRFAERIRSPEMSSFGRRRPSFGTTQAQPLQDSLREQELQDESPAESSERKQSLPDSASGGSQTDTVWDELDDLKSRIKKLEITGKIPPTSSAAVSGESSDRPRTATTAPTTIDSSPKHERKPEMEDKPATPDNTVGGPNVATIHPLLHAALAKAKTLLNPSLYRTLEATASDALQLAALTGGAGPQGTAYSAASIINGVTVADRHVRRKADTMCRNLTDLCLALCDGKHEPSSVNASPVTINSTRNSPSIRHSRSSIGTADTFDRGNNRPLSRLEARRSSILGLGAIDSIGSSPRGRAESHFSSDQEGTPTHIRNTPPQELRNVNRASSRLLSARRSIRDQSGSGDDDPTLRPPSRAMTDIGGSRAKPYSPREYTTQPTHRSPSLRESLAARRSGGESYENIPRESSSRVSSLNIDSARRRQYLDPGTPPTVREEEEGSVGPGSVYADSVASQQQPKRRVMSLGGQFGSARRGQGEGVMRQSSLSQRRHVVVE